MACPRPQNPLARTAVEILSTKLDRVDTRLERIEGTLQDHTSTLAGHGAMLTEILRILRGRGPDADRG